MDFASSGLQDHSDIRKAFRYAYADATSPSSRQDTESQLRARAADWLKNNLDALSRAGDTPDEKEKLRRKLQELYDGHLANMPDMVRQNTEGGFVLTNIATALIVQEMATHVSPDLVALALLLPCVRSARDLSAIEKQFGRAYATVLGDVHHIRSYPAMRHDVQKSAPPPVRALLLAGEVCNMQNLVRHYSQQKAKKAPLPSIADSQLDDFLLTLKSLGGVDAGLAQQYVSYVNQLCDVLSCPLRIDAAGATPVLVNLVPPHKGLFPNLDPGNRQMWN